MTTEAWINKILKDTETLFFIRKIIEDKERELGEACNSPEALVGARRCN